jgi:eukaryotic-like serine/threonine-protein kinase
VASGGDSADSAPGLDSEERISAGEVVGPYRIVETLGEGGMGSVCRAVHVDTGVEVALKLLSANAAQKKTALGRFRREAEAVRRINHPNVVTVVDFGADRDFFYLAMELLDGVTLEQTLALQGALTLEEALRLTRQIAEGLAEAHRLGFVHRDLKPGNIMVVGSGLDERAKILDFGLVGMWGDADLTHLTQDGLAIGTPTYMAPEQLTDSRVGPEADLYALGIVAYEMITGGPPFRGPVREVMMKQIVDRPQPLDGLLGFGALVMRLLEKAPEERPKDANEVVESIREVERRVRDSELPTERPRPSRRISSREETPAHTIVDRPSHRKLTPIPLPTSSTDPGENTPVVRASSGIQDDTLPPVRLPQPEESFTDEVQRRPSRRETDRGFLGRIDSLRRSAIVAIALIAALVSAGVTFAMLFLIEGGPASSPGAQRVPSTPRGLQRPRALAEDLDRIESRLLALDERADQRKQSELWREYIELSRQATHNLSPEELRSLSARIRTLSDRVDALASRGGR